MKIVSPNTVTRNESVGAALSIDPMNPVHGLYAAAAVTAGATIVGCVGVTTIAAPGLVLVPGGAACVMAAGAAYMSDRNGRKLSESVDTQPVASVTAPTVAA